MMGIKYLKKGFYTEKMNAIGDAVMRYADAKNDKTKTKEEMSLIRNNSETVLGNIMYENGFREMDDNYISLERDFFNEHGELDDEKLGKFQKEMILNYGLQDVKWTFAATTGSLTQTSKKVMSEHGKDYADYLPIELKREYQKKQKDKYKSKDPNVCSILIFPDGSASGEYDPLKAKITYNELNDRSGFDWNSGYSPNNKVKKTDWVAGFNNDGVWEAVFIDKKNKVKKFETPTAKIVFTDKPNENKNNVEIITTVNDKSGQSGNDAILFDENSLLMDGEEEKYFSVTGEIYGIREIDRNSSISSIKESLLKMEIKRLEALVLKNGDELTLKYYKDKFKELIDEKTRFFTSGDKELHSRLKEVKEDIKSKDISDNIIRGIFELNRSGRKGEEAYNGLIPSIIQNEYDVNLNIFANKPDMDRFINDPELAEEFDEETKNYLTGMGNTFDRELKGFEPQVREQKMNLLSNAVQSIMHEYKPNYSGTGLSKQELIKTAKDIIVHGKKDSANEIRIIKEKNISDHIKENMAARNEKYLDLYKDADFIKWQEKQKISKEMMAEMNSYMKKITDEKKKKIYSETLQNVFRDYEKIKSSTGMKPVELADMVKSIAVDNIIPDKYKSKKIYTENNLTEMIEQSALNNPYKFKEIKNDIYLSKKSEIFGKPLNLNNNADIDIFASSNIMRDLPEEQKNEVMEYIRNAKIPSYDAQDWTSGVVKTLNEFKKKSSTTPLSLSQELAKITTQRETRSPAISFKKESGINLFDSKQLDEFVRTPEFTNTGMTREQLDDVISQNSYAYGGMQNRFVSGFPMVYSSRPVNDFEIDVMNGIESGSIPRNDGSNDIFNVGWSESKSPSGDLNLMFTELGKKLNDVTKNKIDAISSFNSDKPGEMMIKYDDLKTGGEEKSSVEMPTATYNPDNLVYVTNSRPVQQRTKDNQGMIQQEKYQNDGIVIKKGYEQDLSPEDMKIRRIEENYYNDKMQLAKGDGGTGGNTSNDIKKDGNVTKGAVTEIVNKIKKDLSEHI
jgi:hypothetical protein